VPSCDVHRTWCVKLLVGLGNPGRQYADTRHNVGFMVVDRVLAAFPGQSVRSDKLMHVYQTTLVSSPILLMKPQTYMNLSGIAVQAAVEEYQVLPENMIVLYDDLDLPVGRLRIRKHGGHGGHKGMHSIIDHLHTQEFVRLRMGIGRPESTTSDENSQARDQVVDYVLQPFQGDEQPMMAEVLTRATEALQLIVVDQIDSAMNLYNR
jgi:peptidyl-tRNA hydrolase, PTH1 family